MTNSEVVETLQSCRSVYVNLHDKVGHNLTDEELDLLGKFKAIWEEVGCCNPGLMKKAGMCAYELAFLGGYLYDYDLLPQITILVRED